MPGTILNSGARWAPVGLALAASFAACGSTPSSPVAPVRSDVELVQAAMPAIVLVVNARDDGQIGWGAGFFDHRGRILTAQHVVAAPGRLSVLLFEKDRPSYSPMDGGIKRFLFECSRELLPVRVARQDVVSDLALLELDRDIGPRPTLPWAGTPVHPGERVLALGHPQETPWSYSAGVVGALQYGLIQHDATLGPGSSGGPLLNLRGEVVGVNVAQVVSEPVGLSFARPTSVVASALEDRTAATIIDLSSATSSALSCWRAQELALREVADCFDWDTEWRQYVELVGEAARHLPEDLRPRLLACGDGPGARDRWIAGRREKVVRALDPSFVKENKILDPSDPDLPPEIAELLRASIDAMAKSRAEDPVEADYHDVTRLRSRLRQGLRVEDTRRVGPEREWVLLASRNDDGSLAHFSELYVEVRGQWVQRGAPWPDDLAGLPAGWPTPIETFAGKRSYGLAYLIKRAKHGDACGPRPG